MPDYTETLEYFSTVDHQTGEINLRTDTVTLKDGVEVAREHHRGVLAPGDPIDDKDARVVAVAAVVWTPEVVAAQIARVEAETAQLAEMLAASKAVAP